MPDEEIPHQCPAWSLKANVERIETKQDEALGFMRKQDILFERIAHFQKDFEREIEKDTREHNSLFERMRIVEQDKVSKADMSKTHTILWDIGKMLVAALIGIAGFKWIK